MPTLATLPLDENQKQRRRDGVLPTIKKRLLQLIEKFGVFSAIFIGKYQHKTLKEANHDVYAVHSLVSTANNTAKEIPVTVLEKEEQGGDLIAMDLLSKSASDLITGRLTAKENDTSKKGRQLRVEVRRRRCITIGAFYLVLFIVILLPPSASRVFGTGSD
jgi:hypothetical protein